MPSSSGASGTGPSPRTRQADPQSLGEALANANRDLEERSGVGSATSEGRDSLRLAKHLAEDGERRSSASSASSRARRLKEAEETDSILSLGTANSVKAMYQKSGLVSGDGARAAKVLPVVTPIIDKVELAIHQIKNNELDKLAEDKDRSGSGSQVGSISGTGSGSAAGSRIHGQGIGAPPSSSGSAPTTEGTGSGVPMVLPDVVVHNLPLQQQELVQTVVGTVVEKTGKELAEMQAALMKAKAAAREEAQGKLDAEAALAKSRAANLKKEIATDSMASKVEVIQVQDERDDLHDKLVGMEALLNAKMERYQRDVEELRAEAKKREEELKKKQEEERAKLAEKLTVATKEVEKAKRQKILVASERDVIKRSEQFLAKQADAEKEELKVELAAAKLKLGMDVDRLLPEEDLADLQDDPDALWEKLKLAKVSSKKLSQEFEKMRMDLMMAHQEKDEELAELKAKMEAAQVMPGPLGGKPIRGGRRRAPPAAKFKLSSIDEEEDEMASQAGSGVSGQVSSDADGVGDLRDFDDYLGAGETWADVKAEDKQQHLAEVAKLREELHDAESWYKHMEELKKSKDKEYTSKIERLWEQMQAWREEALHKASQNQKLKELSEEVDMEKQAEIAEIKQKILSSDIVHIMGDNGGSSAPMREMNEKLDAYATQCLELRQQVALLKEEKRSMQMRLDDTRYEADITEKRFVKQIDDLQVQLRVCGGGGASPDDAQAAENDIWLKIRGLEEEKNVLRNELECQEVHYLARLEEEQHRSAAAIAKLHEEQSLLEKERTLKDQVEERLKETTKLLMSTRQALQDAENKARQAQAQLVNARATAGAAWFVCPKRNTGPVDIARMPSGLPSEDHSAQAIVWQIISTLGGVAALFCADESFMINDASKKAFGMWGSASLRGASLFSLVFDQAMASWLKSELEAPTISPFMKPGSSKEFWLRELGCVEFRSKLGSAFDASVTCARLPEEASHGRPASILVVIEPVAEETQQMRMRSQRNEHSIPASAYRRGPASITSSVHSEDITANDSVSNVNAHCRPQY